jgi:hypothetical protein
MPPRPLGSGGAADTPLESVRMPGPETVAEYLGALPADRREVVSSVRDLVNAHLPAGYVESIRWGMISWEIPLSRFPDTYNGQPLGAVALAAQKRYTSLYLMCAYLAPGGEAAIRKAYADAGKSLDLGKACLRFKSLDAFLPEAVVPVLEQASVEAMIARHQAARGLRPT